jgi:hypothetical protein
MVSNVSRGRAGRRSLADLAAASTLPAATGAVIEHSPPSPMMASAANEPSNRMAKYPSATVYLPPRAIRLLKEIGLEENRRLTDILAEALNDWLVRKGHPSLDQLGQ